MTALPVVVILKLNCAFRFCLYLPHIFPGTFFLKNFRIHWWSLLLRPNAAGDSTVVVFLNPLFFFLIYCLEFFWKNNSLNELFDSPKTVCVRKTKSKGILEWYKKDFQKSARPLKVMRTLGKNVKGNFSEFWNIAKDLKQSEKCFFKKNGEFLAISFVAF